MYLQIMIKLAFVPGFIRMKIVIIPREYVPECNRTSVLPQDFFFQILPKTVK